ncbi:hypothetical protein SG34_009550 [Thalassomonas viridans]|uniref:Uncharacterized protein n=1 Tax=Thalassomonas viridans TaxID=137584 RepID=A0AAF0C943_9GAMM|nr:hypothetical protein [Thalassomonas viridans]WDE07107.1 hypothetical protein SG34_009550 [Thalassomonas viridans]
MKKLIGAGLVLASSFVAAHASAATMECYVDTQAYDSFTPNQCFAVVWGQSRTTAVFRIAGSTGKPINQVIWSGAASSCGVSGSSCSISIRAYKTYTARATVLYQDGTWDTASATASFESGF